MEIDRMRTVERIAIVEMTRQVLVMWRNVIVGPEMLGRSAFEGYLAAMEAAVIADTIANAGGDPVDGDGGDSDDNDDEIGEDEAGGDDHNNDDAEAGPSTAGIGMS